MREGHAQCVQPELTFAGRQRSAWTSPSISLGLLYQRRKAVSLSPSSRAITPILLPLSFTNRTASALYSAENVRRLPRPFLHHPLLIALSCFSGCPRNRGKSNGRNYRRQGFSVPVRSVNSFSDPLATLFNLRAAALPRSRLRSANNARFIRDLLASGDDYHVRAVA